VRSNMFPNFTAHFQHSAACVRVVRAAWRASERKAQPAERPGADGDDLHISPVHAPQRGPEHTWHFRYEPAGRWCLARVLFTNSATGYLRWWMRVNIRQVAQSW